MSDFVASTPEAKWRHLRDNGQKVLVDLSSNDQISGKPDWFDEERFARAKSAVEKYYIGRYLTTVLHVQSWYDDDIFNPETKGHKSIRQVRAMHRRVQQLMNERHQVKDLQGNKRLWMTQYDVALTQFAFIGLAMLFPVKAAMILATNEELESINYYWRVLGWFMGMRDEFNICSFDKYEDILEFNKLLFQHEYLDVFKQVPCEKGLEMTQSICLALSYFVPLATFNSLSHWWKDCFKFNGYEPQPLTFRERIINMWTDVSFNRFFKSERFVRISNKLHRKRFEQRLKNKDKVYEDLKKKYKNATELTYYSDRVDYFAKPTLEKSQAANAGELPKEEAGKGCLRQVVGPTAIATPESETNPQEPLGGAVFEGAPLGFATVLPELGGGLPGGVQKQVVAA